MKRERITANWPRSTGEEMIPKIFKFSIAYGLIMFALLSILHHCAKADEWFAKTGAGIVHSNPALTANLGVQKDLLPYIVQEAEIGGWHDAARKDSAFGSWSYGFKVENKNTYALTTAGIAGLTATDELLGGHFQFTEQVCFGNKDSSGVGLGVCYRHFSSAGLYVPNVGRDFAVVRISFPIF